MNTSLEEWKRKREERLKREREEEEESDEELYIPLKKRRQLELKLISENESSEKQEEKEEEVEHEYGPQAKKSLIEKIKELPNVNTIESQHDEQEEELMKEISQKAPLKPVHPNSKVDPIKVCWRPPKSIREMSIEEANRIRKKYRIIANGDNIPNPIRSFEAMKFPKAILRALREKDIKKPTPIQIQGIPCILSGRDMIGIAFTGSGKTLVFVLPIIMLALQEEKKMPIISGEGPIALILCPSRELAQQTYEVVTHFVDALTREGYPELKTLLATGGTKMREQEMKIRNGVHIVVATPGRLIHFLNAKKLNLDLCLFVGLDEADRLIDITFEDDIRQIFEHFDSHPRQTVLFSATMPEKILKFAESSLRNPIVVNVGRAGAANMNVVQEIEFVREDAKTIYLLECLQKTPPPVLIFCENKSDVDDIHYFLLSKSVAAVAIHGSKDHDERVMAIQKFKNGDADVLVGTDVASKGLDFPNVKHVINYDMPKEIENYVHRIGRTGRSGKTGLATTFINKNCSESILLDLKHLLKEAKQKIPPVLASLPDPLEKQVEDKLYKGCKYCGGLGHRINNCPKMDREKNAQLSKISDSITGGDY